MLHWTTDPLLVDLEPTFGNNWLTANDLIKTNQQSKFQTTRGQLNLYSIIIRRSDFVSGERILQSFPYLLLDQTWVERLRRKTLFLAEKAHHYFKDTQTNCNIRNWQKRIIRYLEEQKRLPFPLFRLYPSWLEFCHEQTFFSFQSARGEMLQLPLNLNDQIAYLTGVIAGDGHIADYFINVIDSSEKHIKALEVLVKNLFNTRTEVFKSPNANAWNLNILGKWIVRFFNFISGQPINERKYPHLREPLILQKNGTWRNLYWCGVMDADAGYKNDINFTSASKGFVDDFKLYLKEKNIKYKLSKRESKFGSTYAIRIIGKSRKIFKEQIGSNHPQKRVELEQTITRTMPEKCVAKKGDISWLGRVVGFKQNTIKNGYFDFTLIPEIGVINAGKLIKKLRKESKNYIEKKLNLACGLLTHYENNSVSIPMRILNKLIQINESQGNLMSLLDQYNLNYFSKKKAKARLELQPSNELLCLLQGLQIKEGGYILIIGLPNLTLEEYRFSLCETFNLALTPRKRFYNSVLSSYINKFCLITLEI